MTTDKAAPVGELIPFGVYYSREHHNFYDTATKHGMGNEFFIRWMDRADEFPAKPVATAPVGAVPQGDAVRVLIQEREIARRDCAAWVARAEAAEAALASQAARMGELEKDAARWRYARTLGRLPTKTTAGYHYLDGVIHATPTEAIDAAIDKLRGEAG